MIQFPRFGLGCRVERRPVSRPREVIERTRPPTILVNAPAAQHFEILYVVTAGRVGTLKCVDEAHALKARLLDSIYLGRQRDRGQLVNGWRDIVDVSELSAHAPNLRNMAGPGNN